MLHVYIYIYVEVFSLWHLARRLYLITSKKSRIVDSAVLLRKEQIAGFGLVCSYI